MDVPNADHISRDNRVKDAWQHIQDFSLNVRLIATALRKMETNQNIDADTFRADDRTLKIERSAFRGSFRANIEKKCPAKLFLQLFFCFASDCGWRFRPGGWPCRSCSALRPDFCGGEKKMTVEAGFHGLSRK